MAIDSMQQNHCFFLLKVSFGWLCEEALNFPLKMNSVDYFVVTYLILKNWSLPFGFSESLGDLG